MEPASQNEGALMSSSPLLSGVSGSPGHIRVSPTHLSDHPGSCAARTALKARPALRSRASFTYRSGPVGESFALGPVQEGIDLLEFGARNQREQTRAHLGQARRHTGLAKYTEHAVNTYRAHVHTCEDTRLRPVRGHWVVQRGGDDQPLWEAFHWGRLYESPDGTHREFRFLRMDTADPKRRTIAQTALAAFITAFGAPALAPKGSGGWSRPFQLNTDRLGPTGVTKVTVVLIGLADGSRSLLFEGTPAQADALYREHGQGRVREAVNTTTRTPGADCADCKRSTVCTSITRVPGLLGIAPTDHRPRTVSASTLRYFANCPAQAYLRGLRLPKENEYTAANHRGKAVHALLAERHGAPGADSTTTRTAVPGTGTAAPATGTPRTALPCTPAPVAEDWWRESGHDLPSEEGRIGAVMLRRHAQVCPRHTAAPGSLRSEPALTFLDSDANVVVQASPDLLYREEDAMVWRETKTLRRMPSANTDLFVRYPQLALAVVLLAEGALDNDPLSSRVELEILTPGTVDIIPFDPGDPGEVAAARALLHELAGAWYQDDTLAPRPGAHCTYCPVSRWCPERQDPKTVNELTGANGPYEQNGPGAQNGTPEPKTFKEST